MEVQPDISDTKKISSEFKKNKLQRQNKNANNTSGLIDLKSTRISGKLSSDFCYSISKIMSYFLLGNTVVLIIVIQV